ncbi:hypothetical protein JCM19992_02590 [Thermostilla marina]
MISAQLVRAVEALLRRGDLSHRQIAKRLGTSRQTVDRVAAGKHRACREELPTEPVEPIAVRRCPGCGAIATVPCRVCRLREMLAAGRLPKPVPAHGKRRSPGRGTASERWEPLGVNLKGEHLRRYLEVRAAALVRGELEAESADEPAFEEEEKA